MPETASEPSYYRSSIRVKRNMCKPCVAHGINQHMDAKLCPSFEKNIYLVVEEVKYLLEEASISLKSNRMQLQEDLGADRQFNPYTIPDLEDIDQSSIKKYLKWKTRPEQYLHYSFARVVLVHSFLEEAREILSERANFTNEMQRFSSKKLQTTIIKLKTVTCKLYDFTSMLHVSKIKNGVCKYRKRLNLKERNGAWNYVLSIFNYTDTILDLVVNDTLALESPSVKGLCCYNCCGRIKLVCNEQTTCEQRACKKRKYQKERKNDARNNKRRRNKKSRKRNRQNQNA